MGERATIRIKQQHSETPIHFYTHWRGGNIQNIFDDALRRVVSAGRETDESYATRIIFDTLVDGDRSELGFGIIIGDDRPGDVSYDTPCLEWKGDGLPWVSRMPWNSDKQTEPMRLTTYLNLRNHPSVVGSMGNG